MAEDEVGDTGVADGRVIVDFVDALLRSPTELDDGRSALVEELGREGLVDVAAVVAQFQVMNRVADATGIPLDGSLEVVAADLQEELGLRRFASSANSPEAGTGGRLMRKLLGPVARAAMPHLGRVLPGRRSKG